MTPSAAAPPRLTRLQKLLLVLAVVGFAPLAVISFIGSFHALEAEAIRRGFAPGDAWIVPVGVDAGIVGLAVLDLLLTGLRMPMALLHQVVRLLTAATIWFNATAGHDPVGMSMHAILPLLFILYIEAWRHLVRRWTGQQIGIIREGIPWSRWVAAPISTPRMKRRMVLWGETNYHKALQTEQDIRHAYAQLKHRFGDSWKSRTPDDLLWMLKTGVRIPEACARVSELTRADGSSLSPSAPALGSAEQASSARPQPKARPQRAATRQKAAEQHAVVPEPSVRPSTPVPARNTGQGVAASESVAQREAGKLAAVPAEDNEMAERSTTPNRTLKEIAQEHYLHCQRSKLEFDIKALVAEHGGSEGHWRRMRGQLQETFGPIGTSDVTEEPLGDTASEPQPELRSA